MNSPGSALDLAEWVLFRTTTTSLDVVHAVQVLRSHCTALVLQTRSHVWRSEHPASSVSDDIFLHSLSAAAKSDVNYSYLISSGRLPQFQFVRAPCYIKIIAISLLVLSTTAYSYAPSLAFHPHRNVSHKLIRPYYELTCSLYCLPRSFNLGILFHARLGHQAYQESPLCTAFVPQYITI